MPASVSTNEPAKESVCRSLVPVRPCGRGFPDCFLLWILADQRFECGAFAAVLTRFDKNFITICYHVTEHQKRFHRKNGAKQAKNRELLTFSTGFFTRANVFHYTNGKCQKLFSVSPRIFDRSTVNNMVAFESKH